MTLWQRQHKSSSWTFLKLLWQMAIYKIRSCTENNLVTKHLIGCWWASEGNKCILEHIKPYLSGGWIRTGPLFRVIWKQKLKKSKTSLKAKKKKPPQNQQTCFWDLYQVTLQFLALAGLKWRSSLFAYDLKWGQIPGNIYRYFNKIDFLFKSEDHHEQENGNLKLGLICFPWTPFRKPACCSKCIAITVNTKWPLKHSHLVMPSSFLLDPGKSLKVNIYIKL